MEVHELAMSRKSIQFTEKSAWNMDIACLMVMPWYLEQIYIVPMGDILLSIEMT